MLKIIIVTTVVQNVLLKENILMRIYFPIEDGTNPTLRTDENFLNNKYDYQIAETILSKIPKLGPVTDVPLDYMHLVCLGVVKKLIN